MEKLMLNFKAKASNFSSHTDFLARVQAASKVGGQAAVQRFSQRFLQRGIQGSSPGVGLNLIRCITQGVAQDCSFATAKSARWSFGNFGPAFLLLGFCIFSTLRVEASFAPNHRRYMMAKDYFSTLNSRFGVLAEELSPFSDLGQHPQCFQLNYQNQRLLGFNSPRSGRPMSAGPGPNLIRWHSYCGRMVAEAEMQWLATKATAKDPQLKKYLSRWVSPELIALAAEGGKLGVIEYLILKPWRDLAPGIREHQVGHIVAYLIGPKPVVKQMNTISFDQLVKGVQAGPLKDQNGSAFDVLGEIIVAVMLREEYFLY